MVDATEVGTINELPNACAIIGGGVIAVEYANVLAGLGVGVSLLCKDEVRRRRRKKRSRKIRVCCFCAFAKKAMVDHCVYVAWYEMSVT